MLFNAPALFTTTLLALTASTSPVSAIDYRLLANKPGSGSIESFKISFKTQCPFFNPTNNTDANHRSTFFVPGDWQGQNTDSKALVYCTYTNPNGTVFAVTRELVNSLGGSFA
ncbi:hypothetical protein, variant [Cryptococcus amylolentus CBS 6039]|uniref:AA1-like domain-containing protein n=2 Tax=Cryptococcus amylolentus TaxID=104669 RepID=A0A1E3HBG3_9TREE|nr:hypothetical protein, variant [Cryptococcus amylolentus CBS 6039]ODN73680.1 hypothetical protein, variant [Cryptococcus amylolentus CBS 6039]ODO00427.1 hypothetical protein I350_07067 [Cryptococcus amylolentus CBS 6273]